MKKKLYYLLICVFSISLLFSCGTTKFESGLQQLQLGMTKLQVVSMLGKNYKILGAGTTPDGDLETWKYTESNVISGASNERVILNFLNGRLDEWHREFLPPPPTPKSENSDN